jgi:hypothetical protein
MSLETFKTKEEEVIFLFGTHAVDVAHKKGPEYYVRRLNAAEFRDAVRGLRIRIGQERNRFTRALSPDIIGALIHAMLDTEAWDRLVLSAAVDKVPSESSGGSKAKKPTKTAVQRRRITTTSKLDPGSED